MNREIYKRVKNNPKFSELVRKRGGLAWRLSAVVFVLYYSFILLMTFKPSLLGEPMGDGVVSLGILAGVAVILFCVLLTGFYVKRANSEFDRLVEDIKDDARVES